MDLPPPIWLRTFEAAARLGSFSAAAVDLGLTPAAVSQHMRLLEQHLQTTLFERMPRGVTLTDMGEAYAQPVRKGLDDMKVATTGLFGVAKRRNVKVRVSISCAALMIAPRLNEFQHAYPQIDVELSTFVWANRFHEGLSDIDIRFGFGDWTDGRISHLGHEFAVLVCRPDFLQSFEHIPTIDDLAAGHIMTVHGSEADWPQLLEQSGYSMPLQSRVTRLDSSLLALQTVSTSPGTAIVLESFAQSYIERGDVVRPVEDRLAIRPAHFIVERESTEKRDEIRAFSDWVKSIFSNT